MRTGTREQPKWPAQGKQLDQNQKQRQHALTRRLHVSGTPIKVTMTATCGSRRRSYGRGDHTW